MHLELKKRAGCFHCRSAYFRVNCRNCAWLIMPRAQRRKEVVFYVFISILYMFRATSCSSSGESIVSIQHLVYVTLCRWPFGVQVGKEIPDLHTKRSPTQSDINQVLYWYNWVSWWWARGCSKHVENWNKYIENSCASSWSFTKNHNKMHGQQNIKCQKEVWTCATLD